MKVSIWPVTADCVTFSNTENTPGSLLDPLKHVLKVALLAAMLPLLVPAGASAQSSFTAVSVPGTSVIFDPDDVLTAAQLAALKGGGTHSPTPAVRALGFTAGPGQSFTFFTSGTVGNVATDSVGPDGFFLNTSIQSLGSISGYVSPIGFPLLGVFTNGEPSGPPPAPYNYAGGVGQPTFAPALDQVFFIGDGLTGTGSGSRQTFLVPPLATELWLGFADAGGFQGPPGTYGDDIGSLAVSGILKSESGANLVTNGSFEDVTPALGTNEICTTDTAAYPYSACSATGWSGNYQIGNGRTIGIYHVSFGIPQPDPDGNNALILQTYFGKVAPTATQSISILTSGSYTLSFYVANRSSPPGNNGPQTVSVLLDDATIAGGIYDNLPSGWTIKELDFFASAGNHTLTFAGLPISTGDVSAFIDDVTLAPKSMNTAAPSITPSGGVVSGASFQAGISPNSWVTVTGTGLSSITETWANAIVDGNLPTSLSDVSIDIGGQPAYIAYVSPTQINALAPDVGAGSMSVTVKNANGISPPVSVAAQTVQPAFFQWGSQAVATRQNFSLAAKNGTFSGVTTVPAKPGDVIILWGTGFGPTIPSFPIGVEVPSTATYNTASAVSVTVGGIPATVYGAALAPGYAGLYQVAIQIPTSLATGDYPIVAAITGVQSSSATLITVQQ